MKSNRATDDVPASGWLIRRGSRGDTAAASRRDPSGRPGGSISPDGDSVALGKLALFGLAITALLLAAGWYHSFYEIWEDRWFPAWNAHKLPLWERLTNGESYYTHGPLVPVICLAIAWYIYKRVGMPMARCMSSSVFGWVGLILFIALHILGVFGRVKFLSGFCLIGTMASLVLIWGGWRLLRAYWVPILFLAFMIPLPMGTIAGINFKLKFFATREAIWLTRHVFDIPALQDGAYVLLPNDQFDGSPKRLVVENVCGGLRSMIALTFFASLFAVVCRVKGFWRIFMLLIAVPVAILCNVIRITGLNVVAHHYGVDAAREGAWFHDMSGIAVFVLALAILFLIEAIIMRVGKRMNADWTDERLLPFLARIPRGGSLGFARQWPVLITLTLTAGVAIYFAWQPNLPNISAEAENAVPMELTIDNALYTGDRLTLSEDVLSILETNDYLFRHYKSATSPDGFYLLIIFSTNIRNGAHAPEVCIEADGQSIVRTDLVTHDIEGVGHIEMRELLAQDGQSMNLHTYVFKSGDSYTPSYFWQQASIMFNGLTQQNTAGALVRFTIPATRHDQQAARQRLRRAVEELMPQIESSLP